MVTVMASVSVPHLAFPLRLSGGRLATVEQDSMDEIEQCVEIVLRTERGTRLGQIEFGIEDPTFGDTLDLSDMVNAVGTWEPRAITAISDEIDPEDEMLRYVLARITRS